MDIQAPLSAGEMAILKAANVPNPCQAVPTGATARLLVLGLIRRTPFGFGITSAGKLRLRTERSLKTAAR